jgi:outer membrane receptor protein involved in Fe transport
LIRCAGTVVRILFYYDYTNQQVAFEPPGPLVPGYAVITNARKLHSYGTEAETRYRFTDRLTAYASVGLL